MADPKPDAGPGNPRARPDAGCPTDDATVPCPDKPLPVLEIVNRRNNAVISGTKQTVIVGQKIMLLVRTKPSEAMSNIQWRVSGERVKDYTQAPDKGEKTDLAAADLQSATLDFYWIKGGNETVQVSATVRGTQLSASVSYQVLAPTQLSMTSKTGTVDVSDPHFSTPGIYLHFGTFATAPMKLGIEWTFKATAPAGGAGELAGTQLANPARNHTFNDGTPQVFSSGGAFMLDVSVPYAPAVAVAAGRAATWNSSDSPGMQLTSGFTEVKANDHFKIYFMYRPAGADSIWVTLGMLEWHWTGKTTRSGPVAANHWSAPTDVDQSHNPSGAASTELPVWTDNVTSIRWSP